MLSIGFSDYYRNDCWPPMLVQIVPETSQSMELEIRVTSKDLDGDEPFYTKRIPLTPNVEGQAPRIQNFWMYFLPQPTGGGLPSKPDPLKDLQDQLKVGLYTTGGKFIAPLPITSMIQDINRLPGQRETQFVLAVTEAGTNLIGWQDYGIARGLLQDVAMVSVQPRDLPESELGYQAVDVILWANATPLDPSLATDEHKMRALQNYVRQGGHLVILQTLQWKQTTAAFGPMLPVIVGDVVDRMDLDPLRWLANPKAGRKPDQLPREWIPRNLPGPFKVAKALPRPTAIVEEWLEWQTPDGQRVRTPYLARQRYGLGAVTWVAQDLGDPTITRHATTGWAQVWDRVFDWKNDITIPKPQDPESKEYPRANTAADLGAVLPPGTDFPAKSTSLIFLAILFFIFYWVAAGPGSYLFLAGRRRTTLSWFIYALSALVATGVTVLIVHFVLRGPPQIKHVTLVRTTPGEPAVVDVRMGLYIPRDDDETITLKETAKGAISHIEPYGLPPKFADNSTFTARMEYPVPVRDLASEGDPTLTVHYRSTLKKFQARWVGDVGGISGKAAVRSSWPWLEGRLANDTGQDLSDVYLVFKQSSPGEDGTQSAPRGDRIIYLPSWPKATSLDLQTVEKGNVKGRAQLIGRTSGALEAQPGGDRIIDDALIGPNPKSGWAYFWSSPLRSNSFSAVDKSTDELDKRGSASFPMMSLFSRLPPMRSLPDEAGRVELFRRGTRYMDISPAVAAGSLVVLAEAHGGLPIPIEVNGDRVDGDGIVLYQSVIPLDRSIELTAPAPTSQPAEAGK